MRHLLAPAVLLSALWLGTPVGTDDAFAEPEGPGTLYVSAGSVHTGDGRVFSPGAVSIVDGVVQAVGAPQDVPVPAGATRIDGGPHAAVIPGLVAASSQHLSKAGDDPATVSPDVRALDGYDFLADQTRVLAGGVTTVFLSPGSVRVVSGRGAVVKNAGATKSRRTLRADAGLVVGIGDAVNNPPSRIEPPQLPDATSSPLLPHRSQLPVTRAGSMLLLRELFEDPARRTGIRSVWVGVRTAADLEAAIDLAKETGAASTLVGALGVGDVVDAVKSSGLPVVLHWPDVPGRVSASSDPDVEKLRARARRNAGVLARADVPFALAPGSEAALADLLFVLQSSVRAGCPKERALRAVTSDAARILGVDDRVGSLTPGKDGDLVLLSGSPFSLRTFALRTVVDGRVVWERRGAGDVVVVRAAEVHVGDGTVHRPGEVAFEDGKIVEVGPTVGVPPGARFIDVGAGAVMPGMIDAFSHAGLGGEGGSVGGDLSTALTAAKALAAADPSFAVLSAAGVTTVLAAPAGSGRVPGRAAVVKTGAGSLDGRILSPDAGLVVRLANERDLGAAVKQLDGMLKKAKDYQASLDKYAKDKKAYDEWKKKHDAADEKKKKAAEAAAKKEKKEKKEEKEEKEEEKEEEGDKEKPEKESPTKAEEAPPKKPKPKKQDEEKTEPRKPAVNETLAGYQVALTGKVPVFVRAGTVEEIRAALKLLVDKWKMRVIVVGGDEARRERDLLAKANASVIASPRVLVRDRGVPVNLLRELSLSGLPAAVGTDAYLGGAELRELLAYAVSRGLAPHAAVRMVTGDAAKLLGVDDRVGTLAPGRDADLLLYSAPPFEAGSRLLNVFVDGKEVHRADR